MAKVVIATGDKRGTGHWEAGIHLAFERRLRGESDPLVVIHPPGQGVPGMVRDLARGDWKMRQVEIVPRADSCARFANLLLDIGQGFEAAGYELEVLLFHSTIERSELPLVLANRAIERGVSATLLVAPRVREQQLTKRVQSRAELLVQRRYRSMYSMVRGRAASRHGA